MDRGVREAEGHGLGSFNSVSLYNKNRKMVRPNNSAQSNTILVMAS